MRGIAIQDKKDLDATLADLHSRGEELERAWFAHNELMVSDLAASETNFAALLEAVTKRLKTAKLCFRAEDKIQFDELITLDNSLEGVILSNEKESKKMNQPKTTQIISSLRIIANELHSNATLEEAAVRMEELLVLVDGAYDRIELYKPGPDEKYNIKWRKNWMENARKCGAQPS